MKNAAALSALQVKKLLPGTHAVGGVRGLYLRVYPQGGGFYFLRYMDANKKRRDCSLGNVPGLTLAEARRLASDYRARIDAGADPVAERREARERERAQAEKCPTFDEVARARIDALEANGKWAHNATGKRQALQRLHKHFSPVLGCLPMAAVTPELIAEALRPLRTLSASSFLKARSLMRDIIEEAITRGLYPSQWNPLAAGGPVDHLLKTVAYVGKEAENMGACSVDEIPRLFAELGQTGIQGVASASANVCRFAMLTAARSQAVRCARWEDMDLEKGVWTIPREFDKIKALKSDRTVYLSSAAVALLREREAVRLDGCPWVFPSNRGGVISANALGQLLKGLHEKRLAMDGVGWIDAEKSQRQGKPCKISAHGLRASFRTWAKNAAHGNNRRFDQEAAEKCLLHKTDSKFNGAYDRDDLEKERRFLMELWGVYCTTGKWPDELENAAPGKDE